MIKNYTSEKISYTFEKIQRVLLAHNAKSINYMYNEGKTIGLIFVVEISGQDYGFRLPARIENVENIFLKEKRKKERSEWNRSSIKLTQSEKDQAYRTAWANIRDWVDAQMAMIDTEMASLEELFLPFLVGRNNQSLFERYKEDFKKLTASIDGEVIE